MRTTEPPAHARPYTVTDLVFGIDRVYPVKVKDGQTGEMLTADEVAMMQYAMHLEQRVKHLESDVERLEPAYIREAAAKEKERELNEVRAKGKGKVEKGQAEKAATTAKE